MKHQILRKSAQTNPNQKGKGKNCDKEKMLAHIEVCPFIVKGGSQKIWKTSKNKERMELLGQGRTAT